MLSGFSFVSAFFLLLLPLTVKKIIYDITLHYTLRRQNETLPCGILIKMLAFPFLRMAAGR